MTQEDSKIIFGNIPYLASLSDTLVERLEVAVGSALEGGTGDDHVGALFLEMIPDMEHSYKAYIARHPTALSHLNSLPQSQALTAYLSRSKILAGSLTHSWDLPSLLVKPVQRLLRYSLLLSAIIAETPDSHPDKENLMQARDMMEDATREVNEETRRREVVKEVLNPKPEETKGRKGRTSAVSASVNMKRIKRLRTDQEKDDNQEAEEVASMGLVLKQTDLFINGFAKEVLEWVMNVKDTIKMLRVWAIDFAHVTGLAMDHSSEAFHAFLSVVDHLSPLGEDLESAVRDKLLVQLARLGNSMRGPLRLLETMNTLEPLHYGLLNINFGKYRPPAEFLDASQSYLALRGQLYSELPRYLTLLDKGITNSLLQLAGWQTSYWTDVYDRWGSLWDALRVDDEMNAGAEETENVWWGRWAEVAQIIDGLNIVNAGMIYPESPVVQTQVTGYPRTSPTSSPSSPSSRMLVSGSTDSSSLRSRRTRSKENMRVEKSSPVVVRIPIPRRKKNTLLSAPSTIETSFSSGSSSAVTTSDRSSFTPQDSDLDTSATSPSSSARSNPNIARALYSCRVVHPCNPPDGITYRNHPFFTLQVDEVFDVLQDFGHPSLYDDLPLYVDGKDCLLLVRDRLGGVGWSLASFLKPLGRRLRQKSIITPSGTLAEAQEPG
jgi:hypothetical protein